MNTPLALFFFIALLAFREGVVRWMTKHWGKRVVVIYAVLLAGFALVKML